MAEMAVAATVQTELGLAAEQLRGVAADPQREAVDLWAALARMARGDVWLSRGHTPQPALVREFRSAVALRAAGAPLAHAAGTAAFRSLTLVVDRQVLIPRPETEGLVDHVLAWGRGRTGSWGTAVDVGTGSACIALALAVEGRFNQIVAIDNSPAALEVAGRNVRAARLAVPVRLVAGNLTSSLRGRSADVVVANPPYLSQSEHDTLDPSVRNHEPRGALVGGTTGTELTARLIKDARDGLVSGGLLAVEVDCERSASTEALARASGFDDVRVEADLFGRARYLIATREHG